MSSKSLGYRPPWIQNGFVEKKGYGNKEAAALDEKVRRKENETNGLTRTV